MISLIQHHHFQTALIPEGWARNVRVAIRAGVIESLEPGTAPETGDECHRLVVPGLPNVHSHAFQRGMAGMTERRGPTADSFWTWREVMYRFVERLDPGQIEAIAALAYMEMLETGFTRVGEFNYLHHDTGGHAFADPAEIGVSLASAAASTGIALTLLPVFYAHSGFGGAAPTDGQRRFVSSIDLYARILEGSRAAVGTLTDGVLGIAPHSLRAVTPDQLNSLVDLWPQGPIHIHVAEQVREVEDCLAWSGARPVEWLLDHAPVDQRWCLIHATHMTRHEVTGMARSGAVAGLCPITEANLGDGFFEAPDFIEAGGRFGVGSDSNVLIDAAEELRMLEYGQRLLRQARNVLSSPRYPSTGEALFRGVLTCGAAALGAPSGLAVGAPADFVELDLEHPAMAGGAEEFCLDRWIFGAGRSAVDNVWRRGERLVSRGRHRDRQAIVARYRGVLDRLLA